MTTGVVVIQTLMAGAFGASIGSFANVIIMRTHAGRSYLTGRSACPHCGRSLRWWELIPVLSFVALGGRCRTCRHRLTLQYILLECLSAAIFMTVWLRFGWTWLMPLGWVVGTVMLIIAIYDFHWSLIPDEFSIFFIIAGLASGLVARIPLWEIALGGGLGAAFFGLQHVLSRGRWVGSGDILLGLGLGLLLGWRDLLVTLVIAYLVGSVIASVQIIRHRASTKKAMAFGPYLMAAGFVVWLWGPAIVQWYLLYVIRF
jgi:leader peptidase (prepilin peptidase)/N-methyltransferase